MQFIQSHLLLIASVVVSVLVHVTIYYLSDVIIVHVTQVMWYLKLESATRLWINILSAFVWYYLLLGIGQTEEVNIYQSFD
jgi:hypothetical protein